MESDRRAGSTLTWQQNGVTIADPAQVILESEPYRRLAYSFHTFTPEFAAAVGFSDELLARMTSERRSRLPSTSSRSGRRSGWPSFTTTSNPEAPFWSSSAEAGQQSSPTSRPRSKPARPCPPAIRPVRIPSGSAERCHGSARPNGTDRLPAFLCCGEVTRFGHAGGECLLVGRRQADPFPASAVRCQGCTAVLRRLAIMPPLPGRRRCGGAGWMFIGQG